MRVYTNPDVVGCEVVFNAMGIPEQWRSDEAEFDRVNALGFLSFEGLAILPNGVTYYGDELSAASGAPTPGWR